MITKEVFQEQQDDLQKQLNDAELEIRRLRDALSSGEAKVLGLQGALQLLNHQVAKFFPVENEDSTQTSAESAPAQKTVRKTQLKNSNG